MLVEGTVYVWIVECFLKSPGSLVAALSAIVSNLVQLKHS